MNFRILVFPTNGSASEDGNVNYTSYHAVSHPTLNFEEDIFKEETFVGNPNADIDENIQTFLARVRGLGYKVETSSTQIVWLGEGDTY